MKHRLLNYSSNLLPTAALTVLASSFSVAAVPNPAPGDIFIGFRASSGDGSSVSYLVKVATSSQLGAVPAGSSVTLGSLGDLGTDLVTTFGSGWNTRDNLFWGAFGIGSSASAVVFASRERSPVSSASVAWPNLTDIARASTHSQINSVLNSIGGYRGSSETPNSPVATLQTNFSAASSYSYQVATAGTTDFGSVSQWTSIEGDFGGGVSGTALDLYRLSSSGVFRLGYFSINSAGSISYTSNPDSDGDGLADAWEQQYFGNLAQTGAGDPDGDGQTNSEEQLTGTNPAAGSSHFGLAGFARSPGAAVFSFPTIPSRTYRIHYSLDLSNGSWQLIDTFPGGPAPAVLQYEDDDPVRLSNSRGFYKVSVTSP